MKKKKSLEWQDCSEPDIAAFIRDWLPTLDLKSGGVFFLDGPMGAGKTTFARYFLEALGLKNQTRGSPSFPVIQSYAWESKGQAHPVYHIDVYHIDVYRLKSDADLVDAGVEAALEEKNSLVLLEWSEQFPLYFQYWRSVGIKIKPVWVIELTLSGLAPDVRSITLTQQDQVQ